MPTPADIRPGVLVMPKASEAEREAFWVGLMSALAKHESTWNSLCASGGGGAWIGLSADLARYGTAVRLRGADFGSAPNDGAANLDCAVRIASVQVKRDGMVAGNGASGMGGDLGAVPQQREARRHGRLDTCTELLPEKGSLGHLRCDERSPKGRQLRRLISFLAQHTARHLGQVAADIGAGPYPHQFGADQALPEPDRSCPRFRRPSTCGPPSAGSSGSRRISQSATSRKEAPLAWWKPAGSAEIAPMTKRKRFGFF